MTMTVDEALKHADGEVAFHSSNDIERDDTRCMQTLAAEVRRLRAELAEATRQLETCRKGSNNVLDMSLGTQQKLGDAEREIERLQKVVADQALTIGTLKDSVAAQVSVIENYGKEAAASRLALDVALKEVERWKAETNRLADAFASKQNVALKALKWFEEREPLVDEAIAASSYHETADRVSDIAMFERRSPKPGAATLEKENPDGR